jgi:hypothetical protein
MGSFVSKLKEKTKTEKTPVPATTTPAKVEKMTTPPFSHFAGAQTEFKVCLSVPGFHNLLPFLQFQLTEPASHR